MSIADWPKTDRPREKLLSKGPASLSDAELLAIFLRSRVQGKSAIDIGRELLGHFKTLRSVLDAEQAEFCNFQGLGTTKYVQFKAALELGRRYLEDTIKRDPPLKNPDATRHFLKARLRAYHNEVFACLFLDNRHRVIEFEELFTGTIDNASIHPREVVKRALFYNASAVIFAHNHPSGYPEPSSADLGITKRLCAALALIDVNVIDHFVVGDSETVSFAERGLI